MTTNRLKLELVHKLSSNIDMLKLLNNNQLHKECFYGAINNNLNIVNFLKELGFNTYNEDIYMKKTLNGSVTYSNKKKQRYCDFEKDNKEMIYVQRRHK